MQHDLPFPCNGDQRRRDDGRRGCDIHDGGLRAAGRHHNNPHGLHRDECDTQRNGQPERRRHECMVRLRFDDQLRQQHAGADAGRRQQCPPDRRRRCLRPRLRHDLPLPCQGDECARLGKRDRSGVLPPCSTLISSLLTVVNDTTALRVLNASTLAPVASIPVPASSGNYDVVIAPKQSLAFAARGDSIWIVDLTVSPPVLAAGLNPIPAPGGLPLVEDLSLTRDGRFLVASDGGAVSPLVVIDTATRAVVATVDLNANHNSVEVCDNGSVLVTSVDNTVRRWTISAAGALTDTGQSLTLPLAGPNNTACGPGGYGRHRGEPRDGRLAILSRERDDGRFDPGAPRKRVRHQRRDQRRRHESVRPPRQRFADGVRVQPGHGCVRFAVVVNERGPGTDVLRRRPGRDRPQRPPGVCKHVQRIRRIAERKVLVSSMAARPQFRRRASR